jgi:hypothetical protein
LIFPNISNEEIIIVDALGRNVSFTSSFVNENQVKIKIENTQNQLLLLRINSASSTKTFKIKSLSKF